MTATVWYLEALSETGRCSVRSGTTAGSVAVDPPPAPARSPRLRPSSPPSARPQLTPRASSVSATAWCAPHDACTCVAHLAFLAGGYAEAAELSGRWVFWLLSSRVFIYMHFGDLDAAAKDDVFKVRGHFRLHVHSVFVRRGHASTPKRHNGMFLLDASAATENV